MIGSNDKRVFLSADVFKRLLKKYCVRVMKDEFCFLPLLLLSG